MKQVKGKLGIAFVILGIIIMFLMEAMRPKPIDWEQNFEKKSNAPFGCEALFDFLDDIFPNQEIEVNNQSLYTSLNLNDFSEEESKSNLIIITDLLQIDQFVTDKLIDFVERGNHVFISAHDIEDSFKDSLNLGIKWNWSIHPKEIRDSVELAFTNKNIDNKPLSFAYNRGLYNFHINSFDTLNTTVLGTKDSLVNFIKTKRGSGYFFIHTTPMAFGNLNVVEAKKHDYAFIALSHLPARKTFWDEFYKPQRKYNASSIGYILSQPALNMAYVVFMITIFVFLIFELKRKQRIIPIINPKENSTLKFVGAVSRLYYFKKNHKDIAAKKYSYFLEYIRSKYYLKTIEIDENFIQNLTYKTGIDKKELEDTFKRINQILQKPKINEPELHRVNSLIETFYSKTTK